MPTNDDEAREIEANKAIFALTLSQTGTFDDCLAVLYSMRFGPPEPNIVAAAVFRLATIEVETAALDEASPWADASQDCSREILARYDRLRIERTRIATAIADAFTSARSLREDCIRVSELRPDEEPQGPIAEDFDQFPPNTRH